MHAPDPDRPDRHDRPTVEVVVGPDAARAGEAVRTHLAAGTRVAGFVGAADDPAVDEFVADVIRPASPTVHVVDMPFA